KVWMKSPRLYQALFCCGNGWYHLPERVIRLSSSCMQYPPTLSQYLLSQLAKNPECHQLALIMQDLAVIGKLISAQINKAGLLNILGAAGQTNIQGEQVQKLDVFANTLCRTYLSRTGHFAAMASEEEET